jgi:transcriptional regulator with XRE-family HTH domain
MTERSTSDAIKELRVALGISQETLAHRIGVTLRTVARWETGDRVPLEGLAKLLNVAYEVLPTIPPTDTPTAFVDHFVGAIASIIDPVLSSGNILPSSVRELILVNEFLLRLRSGSPEIAPIVKRLDKWAAERSREYAKKGYPRPKGPKE